MEKERKITAPDGCEIEKVELVDGVAVVTFREKERKLPKSWEEFFNMYPITNKEFYIDDFSRVFDRTEVGDEQNSDEYKNMLPDREMAEAVLALCQLIQLRDRYNGDWVPDWNDGDEEKYTIEFRRTTTIVDFHETYSTSPLYFKTKKLRDEFLRNFSPLIEKLKPLYGIREEKYIKVEEKGGKE